MNKKTLVSGAPRSRVLSSLVTLAMLALPNSIRRSSGQRRNGRGRHELRVRLDKTLTSKYSRVDDKFTATVVDAGQFNWAKIAGHIESIKQSDRFKGSSEMYLSFDRIRLRNGESYPVSAEIIRLYDLRSGEQVDADGGIETSGRGPQTLKRTGIGALAGGVFGGGKGAASGSKDLVLDLGVEMLIRVSRNQER